MPRDPDVFGKHSSSSRSSVSLTSRATSIDVLERRALGRVEVEHDPVGPVGLVDARRPRVQVDAAHVRHPQERELVVHERVVDDLLLALARRCRERALRSIHSGMCDGALLLEEVLALPAVGVALHRERPSAQVRDEDLRDVAVVRDEIALRDPLVRPERLVEVRETKLPLPALHDGRKRRALTAHVRCLLVLTQAQVRGRAQPALVRPLGELDLGDELRLDPDDVRAPYARHLRHLGERRVGALERREHALGAARSLGRRSPFRRFPPSAAHPRRVPRRRARRTRRRAVPVRACSPAITTSCVWRSLSLCQSRRPAARRYCESAFLATTPSSSC